MTRRDQAHLRRHLERGDHAAFAAALEPLCQREVNRVARNGIEPEDLMQEARFAVLKVAQNWTPDRKANPLTLAVTYVRNELWKVTKQQLTANRRANISPLSLNAPVGGDPDNAPLGQMIPAAGPTPEELAEQRDDLRLLTQRVAVLPLRVRSNIDQAKDGSPLARTAAALAAGHTPRSVTIYLTRRPGETTDDAIRRAERKTGAVAIDATKRKMRNGRECAPQGRATADGSLGRPVWRVDLLQPPIRAEAAA